MSTLRPDQLPTPTTLAPAARPVATIAPAAGAWAPSVAPVAPVAAVAPAPRSRTLRIAVAGAALAVVVLGGAAVALRGGGTADAADRGHGTEVGDRPDETDTTDGGWPGEEGEGSGNEAGNASIDVAAAYQAIIGFSPSDDTVDCVTSAMQPMLADVQAVVDGTVGTYDQVVSAMTPFAQCAPADDFDAAVLAGAAQVLQGYQLDSSCASSVVATFTVADRVDVLASAYADPESFAQRLSSTFAPCAF